MEDWMKRKTMKLRTIAALTITMLLLTLIASVAYAATAGPNNAGTGANVTGVGTIDWADPGNITTVGSPYATATSVPSGGGITSYLRGTNYGFSIPSGSTINGITVVIYRRSSGSTSPFISDYIVSLVKAGTITGENKAATGTDWPSGSFGTATYGGAAQLWGTTWSADQINASDFGVVLSATNPNTSVIRTATVDYMQITVTYTLPGTTTSVDCGGGTPTVPYGSGISCVATVTPSAGSNTPTGTVSWTTGGSGGFATSPCTLSGSGASATCSVTYTPSAVGTGSHLITATYSGDTNFASSFGAQTVTVNKATPTLFLAPPQRSRMTA
jgi:hypothetical protein